MSGALRRSVLGIDAAWTTKNPSGVALIEETDTGWRLVSVAASYAAFVGGEQKQSVAVRNLLYAASIQIGKPVDLIAVDMPLSHRPILARRRSDDLISSLYSSRKVSTHSPIPERPGPLSEAFRVECEMAGYGLEVTGCPARGLVEIYPHPALLELTGAAIRLPYKVHKARGSQPRKSYWPHLPLSERMANLLTVWSGIVAALEQQVRGVKSALPLPTKDASPAELKAFEDKLDAIVSAWAGGCVLMGTAVAHGDEHSAIWVPKPVHGGLPFKLPVSKDPSAFGGVQGQSPWSAKPTMRFNHIAQRVAAEHFDLIAEMLMTQLGFTQLRRTERAIWLRQPGANIDLQLSRSPTTNRDEDKLRSQVSFLSDTPRADLEKLAEWLTARGLPAGVGSYSPREFYLDAPDALVDFVIEAMLPELADYPIKE
ncbi:DUF429 domain-containing protein [Rhodovarius crocodyli]|nr:DUF429 domain-containing protein [Rhodovarius crocodyli]